MASGHGLLLSLAARKSVQTQWFLFPLIKDLVALDPH